MAWVFSFPVVFNSSKSRIKAAGAGTAAVHVCCPLGAGIAMGPAVQRPSSVQLQAHLGREGQRRRSATLHTEIPKVHLLTSGSECLYNVEESDSFKSRIN